MILFLCAPGDISARGFVAGLRHGFNLDARIVTPQELVYSADMQHALDGTKAFSAVKVGDEILDSTTITGVVNRLEFLPDAHLGNVKPEDQGYIQQELLAIWSSWVRALPCPVINRPAAVAMCGPMFHPAVWQNYAAVVGLPTAKIIHDADQPDPVPPQPLQSAIVCRGQCHSTTLPSDWAAACCDLAAYAGFDMLHLWFGQGPEGLAFSYASPIPDLGQAGPPLTAQMAQILQGGAQ